MLTIPSPGYQRSTASFPKISHDTPEKKNSMNCITMVRGRPPALIWIRFYSTGTATGPRADSNEAKQKAWEDPRVRELKDEFADLRESYSRYPSCWLSWVV